jgi:hypothetical protein
MPPILYGTAWKKEHTEELVVQAVLQGFRGESLFSPLLSSSTAPPLHFAKYSAAMLLDLWPAAQHAV